MSALTNANSGEGVPHARATDHLVGDADATRQEVQVLQVTFIANVELPQNAGSVKFDPLNNPQFREELAGAMSAELRSITVVATGVGGAGANNVVVAIMPTGVATMYDDAMTSRIVAYTAVAKESVYQLSVRLGVKDGMGRELVRHRSDGVLGAYTLAGALTPIIVFAQADPGCTGTARVMMVVNLKYPLDHSISLKVPRSHGQPSQSAPSKQYRPDPRTTST